MMVDFYIFFPLLMVIFICWVLWNRNYFYALWHLPGPFTIPFIGNFFWLIRPKKDPVDVMLDYIIKYKGQVAVWMGSQLTFIVTNPDHLKILFTSHSMLDHTKLYDVLKPCFGDGLLTANGPKWKSARKVCNTAFHPNVVRTFVEKYHKHSNILIELIRKEVGKGEFKSYPYVRNCTVDIIMDTQLGYDKLNCQFKQHEEIDEIDNLMYHLARRPIKFWEEFDWLFYQLPAGRYFRKRQDPIIKFFERIIGEVRRDYEKTKDKDDKGGEKLFIHRLFEWKELTDEEILHHVNTILLSGYETSANTLGFVLLMLGVHPEVQDKVFEEDRQIQEKLNYREPDADDLNLYEYLDQVIKETLRLFSVGLGTHRVAKEDIQIGEHFVPAGSNVSTLFYFTHRRHNLYKNPSVFNPENFSPENVEKRHPYAFVPFSAGPRNCIGTKYAWTVMKVIISKMVRNFRIIANQQVKDIKLTSDVTLHNPDGFRIRLENR